MCFQHQCTVTSVVQVADDSRLMKEQVLGQHRDLGDVVTHVLPHIQVRHWKRVELHGSWH